MSTKSVPEPWKAGAAGRSSRVDRLTGACPVCPGIKRRVSMDPGEPPRDAGRPGPRLAKPGPARHGGGQGEARSASRAGPTAPPRNAHRLVERLRSPGDRRARRRAPDEKAALFSYGDPMPVDHLRFHRPHHQLHNTFGAGGFGKQAEAFARFFGTPGFLIGQTIVVAIWIGANVVGVASRWDPYPCLLYTSPSP